MVVDSIIPVNSCQQQVGKAAWLMWGWKVGAQAMIKDEMEEEREERTQ